MLGTSPLDNLARDVYIATTAHDGERAGQVITWVTHASLVPEKRNVIAVFSRFHHTYEILGAEGRFALNLPTERQKDLAVLFGLYSGHELDKFEDPRVRCTSRGGLPLLSETAGHAILKVFSEVDLGDRVAVISRVVEETYDSTRRPLKLGAFLESCSEQEIARHRSNYAKMIERDSAYIRDAL